MLVVRPSNFVDLTSIERLLNATDARVTTLPKDRDKLSEKSVSLTTPLKVVSIRTVRPRFCLCWKTPTTRR